MKKLVALGPFSKLAELQILQNLYSPYTLSRILELRRGNLVRKDVLYLLPNDGKVGKVKVAHLQTHNLWIAKK
jgi:hypothetical protein